MKATQQGYQCQLLQQKDIIDLCYFIQHVYNMDTKKLFLNYHNKKWHETLSKINRVELMNGFRNLITLRNDMLTKQVMFFPVSAKNFLKLCLNEEI